MNAIKYLEEQLPKIDMFRRAPLQLTFEFWDGKWHCHYGWFEPYDSLYSLDFLKRDGSVLEGVVEALVRDTEKCVAAIDEFTSNHRPYHLGLDSVEAVYALLIDGKIETYRITDIRSGPYDTIKWRRDTRKHSGTQSDLTQFWVRR